MNNESDIVAQMAQVPVLQEPADLKPDIGIKHEAASVAMDAINQSHSDDFQGHPPGTDTKRVGWKQWEDDLLRRLVMKYGEKSWTAISKEFPGREPKQCRERWVNHLIPGVRKGRLTDDEWEEVLKLQVEYGNKWSEIARFLPGRTPNQIKNYWHSQVRSAKDVSLDLNAPMIMGPNGTPIPMPPPGDVSRKRKRVNDTESDTDSHVKLPRLNLNEEAIQVEMPALPAYPVFPGVTPLDVTTIPQYPNLFSGMDGNGAVQVANEADLPLPNMALPFELPLTVLPDPNSVS
jgi:hypothetical protein